jgi:hypothetical protein
MRSRFWLPTTSQKLTHDLLVHCSMEMNREVPKSCPNRNILTTSYRSQHFSTCIFSRSSKTRSSQAPVMNNEDITP